MQTASTPAAPARVYRMDRSKRMEPARIDRGIRTEQGEFTCVHCGHSFPCEILTWEGIRTMPNICEACLPIVMAAGYSSRTQTDERQLLRERWEIICPPEYRDFDKAKLPAPEMIDKVMDWCYGPRSLLLYGPTQRGKTRCAYRLLRRLHFEERVKIEAWYAGDWVNECAKRFREGDGENWVSAQSKVALLFLDDLGNEPSGERGEGEIFGVIKRRCEHRLPTIATTNKVVEDFDSAGRNDTRGAALASRLIDFFDEIRF